MQRIIEPDDIFALQAAMKVDCQLILYDNQLLFYPVLPILTRLLTFSEKELVCDASTKFKRQSVYRSVKRFSIAQREMGEIGVTFHGFTMRVIQALVARNYTYNLLDYRLANDKLAEFPAPDLDAMYGFRFKQEELLRTFLLANRSGLIGAPTRYGKCLGKDTPVMLYDKTIKMVQHIHIGEKLMGPDGKPRTVICTTMGKEFSYKVVPDNGEAWSCNESHILSLKVVVEKYKNWRHGDICNISVRDYLATPKAFKNSMQLWYAAIPGTDVEVEYTSAFKLEELGMQAYYGFELLSGTDKLFLLGDNCVTHNTTLIVNTLRAFPTLTTVVTAPGVDLVRQLYRDITCPERGIRNREVKLICSGSRTKYPSDTGITVCSADSLDKCDFEGTDLVLIDEPHALVTESRITELDKFTRARRLGFGATLTGRFDKRDALIEGVIGPLVCERTYKEGVKEGAIAPIHVIFLRVNITPASFYDRSDAYDAYMFKSEDMARVTRRICEEIIPEDWQTLLFIKHEDQANVYIKELGDDKTVAMAKLMSNKRRAEVTALLQQNVIKRCLCTKIYVQGVTYSDLRVLVNLEGGGANTGAIQKPGRLAEIRPNKKCGIMIDFDFVCEGDSDTTDLYGDNWKGPGVDSNARRQAYVDKGYEVHDVTTLEELKATFDRIK